VRNICEDENGIHTCVSSIKLVSLRVHCDRRVVAEVEMDHVIIASKADHGSGGNSFTGSAVSSCDSAVGISSEDEPSASSSGCGLFTCFGSCSLNLVRIVERQNHRSSPTPFARSSNFSYHSKAASCFFFFFFPQFGHGHCDN
jgi:hypothetical protein